MSWMTGLGQGLQNFGSLLLQNQLDERRREEEARRFALQLALQREQLAQQASHQDRVLDRQEAQDAFAQNQFLIQNAPAGTRVGPETRQGIEAHPALAPFIKPDLAFATGEIPVQGGLPAGAGAVPPGMVQGGLQASPAIPTPATTPGSVDTGYGMTVPTEDSRMRTAQIAAAASMARLTHSWQMRQAIEAQKTMLRQKALELQEKAINATDENSKRDFAAAMAAVNAQLARLDFDAQRFDADQQYRMGPGLDLQLDSRDIAAYRAENPGTGGSSGGLGFGAFAAQMMGPGGQGAPAPTAPAPETKRPPLARPNRPDASAPRKRKNRKGEIEQYNPQTRTWSVVTPAPKK